MAVSSLHQLHDPISAHDSLHPPPQGGGAGGGGSSFVDAFRESLREFPLDGPSGQVDENNFLDFAANFAAAAQVAQPMSDESLSSDRKSTKNRRESDNYSPSAGKPPRQPHDDEYHMSQPTDVAVGSLFSPAAVAATGKTDPKGPTAVMTVRVSRVPPRSAKYVPPIYPFAPLQRKTTTYRGYPIDGVETMKKHSRWKLQLVPAAVSPPTEPLPAFPDISTLRRSKDGTYRSVHKMPPLTTTQRQYNSGDAWLNTKGGVRRGGAKVPHPDDVEIGTPAPLSEFFYAAASAADSYGTVKGSQAVAVRIDKRGNQHSIYDAAVIKGTTSMFADDKMAAGRRQQHRASASRGSSEGSVRLDDDEDDGQVVLLSSSGSDTRLRERSSRSGTHKKQSSSVDRHHAAAAAARGCPPSLPPSEASDR